MFSSLRRQAEGPDRFLRRSLLTACGLCGASGQNALKPVEWVCLTGPGSAYPLLHVRRPLLSPSLHQTGRVIIPGVPEDLLYHLEILTIPLITPGNTHLITPHQSPGVITLDCHYIETQEEKGLLFKAISRHPFIVLKCPPPVKSLLTDPPIT